MPVYLFFDILFYLEYQMKFSKRRCIGDRIDADMIRHLDSMHIIMPLMMKNRADNEAFFTQTVETDRLDAWLEKKNAANPEHRYTLFHAILAAIGRTIGARPRMNYFIKHGHYYVRNAISFSFIAKKAFSDKGEEAIAIMDYDTDSESSSIDQMHDKVCKFVYDLRVKDKTDDTTDTTDFLCKLPFFITRFIMWLLNWLDDRGFMPKSLMMEDPYLSTVFISNLGSLHMSAGYHHLSNWGTNSIFIVVGEKYRKILRDENGNETEKGFVDIAVTLDERIGDGYYFIKTFRYLTDLLTNPELLDKPCNEDIAFS